MKKFKRLISIVLVLMVIASVTMITCAAVKPAPVTYFYKNAKLPDGVQMPVSIAIIMRQTRQFAYGPFAPDTREALVGDVNLSGSVNIKDATFIQKIIVESPSNSSYFCGYNKGDYAWGSPYRRALMLADVDGNNKVNVRDATATQKYICGIPQNSYLGDSVIYTGKNDIFDIWLNVWVDTSLPEC